ncbi:MAG: CbiX/SirB N-terminal domain-containing protein, partial [Myxococcota bacterium]
EIYGRVEQTQTSKDVQQGHTAVILIDHGSRRDTANQMLGELATLFQSRTNKPYIAVEYAHMELASPTLEQAFQKCVAAGAKHIVVSLFFLSPGRHSLEDIPAMVESLREQYPGVTCDVTQPLGVDSKLVELLEMRIQQALNPIKSSS